VGLFEGVSTCPGVARKIKEKGGKEREIMERYAN